MGGGTLQYMRGGRSSTCQRAASAPSGVWYWSGVVVEGMGPGKSGVECSCCVEFLCGRRQFECRQQREGGREEGRDGGKKR